MVAWVLVEGPSALALYRESRLLGLPSPWAGGCLATQWKLPMHGSQHPLPGVLPPPPPLQAGHWLCCLLCACGATPHRRVGAVVAMVLVVFALPPPDIPPSPPTQVLHQPRPLPGPSYCQRHLAWCGGPAELHTRPALRVCLHGLARLSIIPPATDCRSAGCCRHLLGLYHWALYWRAVCRAFPHVLPQ